MILGLLLLAIALREFEAGELGFSACLFEGYGFARVDSVRGVALCSSRKISPLLPFRIDNQPRQGSAPTLPRKGFCGCAASPTRILSAPALGTELLEYCCTEKTRIGNEVAFETNGFPSTAQLKSAFCNCSSCSNRQRGSRDWATASVHPASRQKGSLLVGGVGAES